MGEVRIRMVGRYVMVLMVFLTPLTTAAFLAMSHCDNPQEAYYIDDGRDYRGQVNVTEDGIPCQNWFSQVPHAHDVDPLRDAAKGIGDHNYCRNFNGLSHPGCFTTEPDVRYAFCNVGAVCEMIQDKPSITFIPRPGSTLSVKDRTNVVSISCFPKPCSIYYTLNDGASSVSGQQKYSGPLALERNTTLQARAIFLDKPSAEGVATYTVVNPTSPPISAQFGPDPAVAYKTAVLVALRGLSPGDFVILYRNKTYVGEYTGPFWIHTPTDIVAVINRTSVVKAFYNVHVEAPLLELYPPSAITAIGGLDFFIKPPAATVPVAIFEVALNNTDWKPLRSRRYRLTQAGTTRVVARAIFSDGVTSFAEAIYAVVPAHPPTLLPPPDAPYTQAITVTCKDPTGTLLVVTQDLVTHSDDDAGNGNGHLKELLLDRPGTYSVGCSYKDSLLVTHEKVGTYVLKTVLLPQPVFWPPCGTVLPRMSLRLRVAAAAMDVSSAEPFEASVTTTAAGAVVDLITREDVGRLSYRLTLPPPTDHTGAGLEVVTVVATRTSNDVFKTPSAEARCTYSVAHLGTYSTPLVAARMLPAACNGPTALRPHDAASVEFNQACAAIIIDRLASCLNFYTAELLAVNTYGPFITAVVTRLSTTALQHQYYESLHLCMLSQQDPVASADPQGPLVKGVTNESSGDLVLAVSWEVVDHATSTRPSFFVKISGFNVHKGSYYFVRKEYGCDDIGLAPLSVHLAEDIDSAKEEPRREAFSKYRGFVYAVFALDTPGVYTLCADLNGVQYVVPARRAASASLSISLLSHAALHVLSQKKGGKDCCGGMVSASRAKLPIHLIVTTDAHDPSSSRVDDFVFSVGLGEWERGALGGELTLPPVNSQPNSLQTVSISLGPRSGISKTCVFYAESTDFSAFEAVITYSFFTVGSGFRRELQEPTKTNEKNAIDGVIAVIIVLESDFKGTEDLYIDIYNGTGDKKTVSTPAIIMPALRKVALPGTLLQLGYGFDNQPKAVYARLDGRVVEATPKNLTLSFLSLAMQSCTQCKSGNCYKDACVCFNKERTLSFLCNSENGEDDKSTESITMAERLIILFSYFGMLLLIGGAIVVSIRRGTARRLHLHHENLHRSSIGGPIRYPSIEEMNIPNDCSEQPSKHKRGIEREK